MSQPERLGPYLVGKPLGKGGMGTVYQAVNGETGEQVAVKTLAPELAVAEGFRERFEAEIESLRTLRHPNIVRLFGYGEENGLLFYSMELVHGVSLEEELRNGRRFDWREVTRIAIQVSRALKHAHDHGIIHRDIKPANILLSEEQVKLADFGIAQLFGGAKLTTARGVVGTADFMSPEQAESRPITDRCDQYSLGSVMYALLAGRPPFRAKSLPQMLQLQRYAEPEPVRRYAPDTPKQLEKVIMQLLEKSPKERFPNAMALAKHLEAMSLAFSRPKVMESDFELRDDPPAPELREPADLAETPADISKVPEEDSRDYETLARPTLGPSDASIVEDPSRIAAEEATDAPQRQRSFTLVPDEHLSNPENRSTWLLLAQAALLVGLLAAGGAGVAWALRPPNADQLYNRIAAAAEGGDEQAVLDAEEDILAFLQRFPKDPRVAQVEPLKQQLALAQTERRMFALLRRRSESDAPLESLYLEAMRNAKDYPELAAEKLKAMTALVAGKSDWDNETEALLEIARDKIKRLEQRVAVRAEAQLPFLNARITSARELVDSDPQAARAICQAVIDIYSKRTWASEVVADAQGVLISLGSEER